MLEIYECIKDKILDFVLYVPRRFYKYFIEVKLIKEENEKLKVLNENMRKTFKAITYECERNDYGFPECNKRKIKELAKVFGDTANSND